MSYIYGAPPVLLCMYLTPLKINFYLKKKKELLVKPENITSYIYSPTFGNAESRLFLFAAQCFNTESMQKVILWHICV
jgi:hypothetical protein